MRHFPGHATMQVGRRSFLLGAPGAFATGLTEALGRSGISEADIGTLPLPAPKSIPGGFDVPPLI
jgi:hypothetical protein